MRVTVERLKQLIASAKEAHAPKSKIMYLEKELDELENGKFNKVARVSQQEEDEESITISIGRIARKQRSADTDYRPFKARIEA